MHSSHLIRPRDAVLGQPFAEPRNRHVADPVSGHVERDTPEGNEIGEFHAADISHNGEVCQPRFGERHTRSICGTYPNMGNRLREFRTARGWTHDDAASAMGVSRGQFIKLERGERRLTSHYIDLAAKAFGVTPGEVIGAPEADEPVAIVGRIGASSDGAIAYADGDGNFGHVPRPPGASDDTVAVEVAGGSMGYLADGSIIYYSTRHLQPLPDMLGVAIIVGLPDGRVLLKKLLRGSDQHLFDLESIVGPTLRDHRVDWFSHIDFIIPPWRAAQVRIT